jgi:hypothetical protein
VIKAFFFILILLVGITTCVVFINRTIYFAKLGGSAHVLYLAAHIVLMISLLVSLASLIGLLPHSALYLGNWQLGLIFYFVCVLVALLKNASKDCNVDKQIKLRLIKQKKGEAEPKPHEGETFQIRLDRFRHDIKTPLSVIDSAVQSLEMLELTQDAEKIARYQRIRRSVAKINDLLISDPISKKN